MFASSGLRPPQTCYPVYELDAASLPASARSRRSIERLLLRTLGMRGRSALPALLSTPSEEAQAAAAEEMKASAMAALPSGRELARPEQHQQLTAGWEGSDAGSQAGNGKDAAEWEGAWLESGEGVEDRHRGSSSSTRSRSKQKATGGLRLEASEEEAPALVSILVPAANTSEEEGGKEAAADGNQGGLLASLSKVFVVMLHPRQRYVIYACSLHSSLLP